MSSEVNKLTPPPTVEPSRPRLTLGDTVAGWRRVIGSVFKRPQRLHYYSYVFQCDAVAVSVYIGYPERRVFKGRIEWAKKQAGVRPGAVMLSCCYLGRMTDAAFRRVE